MRPKLLLSALLTLQLGVAACASSTGSSAYGGSPSLHGLLPGVRPASGSAGDYIKNVVVIVQENRSFENFFAGYPGANAPTYGCAVPVSSGSGSGSYRRTHRGTTSYCPSGDQMVPLQHITLVAPIDLPHNWAASHKEYNKGRMDGFSYFGKDGKYQAYSVVSQHDIQPYWTMAQQYVLADQMYPTEWGGSFTGHLTLIAGDDTIKQTPLRSEVDFPNGLHDDCDSPPNTRSSYINQKKIEHFYAGPYPCFDQWNTIANDLDASGVSWKYYATKTVGAGMWSPFEAMKYVRYGYDWANVIAPQTTVLSDAQYGNLASVSFVSPSKVDSDHPGEGGGGPSWVASVVNAIGESSYWPNTAIVVVWDDWGGWYDNASPPQLDYRGLGFRVPCLIISPYAKQNYVDDTQYEYASILRFIEEVYNLPTIGPPSEGYTDGRATPLDNAFDFTQNPRQFIPIQSSYSIQHFLHERPSNEPVDTQ